METLYTGAGYQIVCDGNQHAWTRRTRVQPKLARVFAGKPCDCARLRSMGIAFPMTMDDRRALSYTSEGSK